MATAIEFDHVGKQYRLGLVSMGTLGNDLKRWWTTSILRKEDPFLTVGEVNDRSVKGDSKYVWALKDIDFKVEQGDVVGIIGRNGAGKSTLLKLLSRVTGPTMGEIRARGRIGSLLEVGTGFHPEMTGRENIYLNGSILGMTKSEIDRKLDEIIDFSGCERYIDTPVKRYSSGMMVRLGFAVAAHLEPEILIVDEVLAVGDAEFQKKAIGKMQDVSKGEGRTVLFVSHNMASVQRLCSRGVLLENGRVKYMGTVGDTIAQYLKDDIVQSSFSGVDGDENIMYLSSASVRSESEDGNFYVDRAVEIAIEFTIKKQVGSMVAGFNIVNRLGHPLIRCDYNDVSQQTTLVPGEYRMAFRIPEFTLAVGEYKIVFDIAERNVRNYASEQSNLTFKVSQGKVLFGDAFSEDNENKTSVVVGDWMTEFVR